MKRETHSNQVTDNHSSHTIPDIQVVDLETGEMENPNTEAAAESSEETYQDEQEPTRKKFHINAHMAMHFALLAAAVIVIIVVVNRLNSWGQFISQDDIFSDGEGTYNDTFDQILPALDANGNLIDTGTGKDLTILMLGNSPLSDDRDSEDGLANMIAEHTGANVINCAVSDSYMAAVQFPYRSDQDPLDAYTPYWLSTLTITDSIKYYYEGAEIEMGESLPPEAGEVVETLTTLDMSTVDVVVFMYDGTDYLLGHGMYTDDNPKDILTYAGNLEASIDLFQKNFPHIRIIVMSPAYAFGVDENGNYISSDIHTYGQHFLSTYFNAEMLSCYNRGVTFVDNLYGTINEDNASEYLTDNIHLNLEGRKLMADRLIYALTYYDN